MDKIILITGASTGFGRTAAETLAQWGYTVFATMRDTSKQIVHRLSEKENRAALMRSAALER